MPVCLVPVESCLADQLLGTGIRFDWLRFRTLGQDRDPTVAMRLAGWLEIPCYTKTCPSRRKNERQSTRGETGIPELPSQFYTGWLVYYLFPSVFYSCSGSWLKTNRILKSLYRSMHFRLVLSQREWKPSSMLTEAEKKATKKEPG